MPNKSIKILYILLGLVLFTTGCWDRVEIEERGFVVGAGIDVTADDQGRDKYVLTFQFVVPSGLQGKEKGGVNGGGGEEAYFNLSSPGNTIFKAIRDMSYRTSRSPYLQHLRMILISDKLARQGGFAKALDLFLRDHEMRRAAKVMIVDGHTHALLNVKPKNEKLPIMYFESVANNPMKSSRIFPPTNIGEVQSYMISKQSFSLPRITRMDGEVTVAGAAVINGEHMQLQGYLNADETSGLNLIKGKAQDGVLEFRMGGDFVAYEIKSSRSTIRADVSDPKRIKFSIHIEMEGNVGEAQLSENVMDSNQIAEIEQRTEDELFRLTTATIHKLQHEYKTDAIGLGVFLNQEHHAVWEQVKEVWDREANYFSRCEINIETKAKVKMIGSAVETRS